MPSQTRSPTSATNLGDWTNEGNVFASDNSYAEATVGSVTQGYLRATDYGFTIPAGATISGVELALERHGQELAGGYDLLDDVVKLVIAGVISGDNKADPGAGAWPLSDATKTYGSGSDLWGLSLTSADVNAVDFGVVVSAVDTTAPVFSFARIDHMPITVYYSERLVGVWSQVIHVHGNQDRVTAHGNAGRVNIAGNQDRVHI